MGQINKQLGVVGIKMEIDIRMPSHNLTQSRGVQREEQKAMNRALRHHEKQLMQF